MPFFLFALQAHAAPTCQRAFSPSRFLVKPPFDSACSASRSFSKPSPLFHTPTLPSSTSHYSHRCKLSPPVICFAQVFAAV
ncbi:hypothetical protein CSUI_010122 [Cystoisospora suis]|uniref:Uncharacterized protein n=1 Tax=Cystoisospora suis TaxID=483139 RepID=A0A2C6KI44_9APIC|nr:hypothetical protein CSUI_010122 [Cystoisospora suis]